MPHVVLQSPHAPITVANKLKATVGETLEADTPKRVTGNGTEEKMTLWVHRPRVRNDFKARLVAEMTEDDGGTRIEGSLGTPGAVRLFMTLWLGFVGCFLVGALGIAIFARPPLAFILPFAGIPTLMLAFGVGLFTLARRSVDADSEAILAFLAETIDARPIDGGAR